jgi:hypothetical protein
MPTAYDIYQTYLKAPAALIQLFEMSSGTSAVYDQPEKYHEPDFKSYELWQVNQRILHISYDWPLLITLQKRRCVLNLCGDVFDRPCHDADLFVSLLPAVLFDGLAHTR